MNTPSTSSHPTNNYATDATDATDAMSMHHSQARLSKHRVGLRNMRAAEETMPNSDPASHRRRTFATSTLTAFAVLLVAGMANASGGGGDDHDPMMELIWQSANLALIVGVIIYFARQPIAQFFAGRRDGIKTELTDAAQLLSQAEQRNSELQRRLVDLSSEVEGIREAATRRADEEAERILTEARAAAQRIRNDAQAAVDQELRRARAALRNEAADLALELAATKLTQNVTESDRERLMDEFIVRVEPSPPSASEGAKS